MRFVHLADLHIGKKMGLFDLMEDQRFILHKIARRVQSVRPDAVLIAGDVYDKSVPSAEAMGLFDGFLNELLDSGAQVLVIGGNHDSQERLAFGSQIMKKQGVYIAGPYEGKLERVPMRDDYGTIDLYLLPYIRPREAARFLDEEFSQTGEAIRAILDREHIDFSGRNVLIAHQFVTSTTQEVIQCDSEVNPIGGLSAVDVSLFEGFDYLALGHLHGPQRVGRDSARYAGSPLKYSFSEARHRKSMVVGEIKRKGELSIELDPLEPLRDVREIRGELEKLMDPEVVKAANSEDYLKVVLTDPVTPVSPMERLSLAYQNIVSLELARSFSPMDIQEPVECARQKDPLELFEAFYRRMNGAPMTGEMRAEIGVLLDEVREGSEP